MKTMDGANNAIIYKRKTVFCKCISFRMGELNPNAYPHHYPERRTRERIDFRHNLMKKREDIEKPPLRNGLSIAISVIAGAYTIYISYTVKDGRQQQEQETT